MSVCSVSFSVTSLPRRDITVSGHYTYKDIVSGLLHNEMVHSLSFPITVSILIIVQLFCLLSYGKCSSVNVFISRALLIEPVHFSMGGDGTAYTGSDNMYQAVPTEPQLEGVQASEHTFRSNDVLKLWIYGEN